MPPGSAFLYVLCQAGAEAALKGLVADARPELRPAFQRPGLVTFKAPAPTLGADARVDVVLARASGAAIGPLRSIAELGPAVDRFCPEGQAVRLHVIERDRWRPGDEPEGFAYGPAAAAVYAAIVAGWSSARPLLDGPAAPVDDARSTGLAGTGLAGTGLAGTGLAGTGLAGTGAGADASIGEWVLDVIVGDEGEPLFVGFHAHEPGRSPHPGGRIPVPLEPEAPSRAYYKLEEAIRWSAAPLRPGDVVCELGSSPGGASLALLQRGLLVHGVDPGAMDPRVLAWRGPRGAHFVHHAAPMGQVAREALPHDLHWIVTDVNLAPQVALESVRRLAARPRPALCGVLCTLKLDTWKGLRHLPTLLKRIAAMGMLEVRATQLPSNRLEVFACGLTAQGLARQAPPRLPRSG
ncbi:MAG: hypothetical protein R3B09_35150 [Nannocystaceae bacterium]